MSVSNLHSMLFPMRLKMLVSHIWDFHAENRNLLKDTMVSVLNMICLKHSWGVLKGFLKGFLKGVFKGFLRGSLKGSLRI